MNKLFLLLIALTVFSSNIFGKTMVYQYVLSFTENTDNSRCPKQESVNKAKFSVCHIRISQGTGENEVVAHSSGVLISPKCVVTSMHAFLGSNWKDGISPIPAGVSLKFAYDATFKVNSFAPTPFASKPYGFDAKDFIVLELQENDVVSASNGNIKVAEIEWEWGKAELTAKKELPVANKAFVLHYIYPNPNLNISYATTETAEPFASTYYKPWGINTIPILDFYETDNLDSYKTDNGSSGGGVFDDDGKLIALIKGAGKGSNRLVSLPIDYIVDKDYGSSAAIFALSKSGLSTIPDRYTSVVSSILSNIKIPFSSNPNSVKPYLHDLPGIECYLGKSTDNFPATQLLGSLDNMGKYDLAIDVMGSATDATTDLNTFSGQTFATITLSSIKNKITSKSTILGSDIVKDEFGHTKSNIYYTQNSLGKAYPTTITFKLEILDVANCQLSIQGASLLDDSKIAGISIHNIDLKYTGAINSTVKSSPPTATAIIPLEGPYATAVYFLSNNGCTYTAMGQCTDCQQGCPGFETVFREIRKVGFIGDLHSGTTDAGFSISWDDGSTETKSVADYQYVSRGNIHEHLYKKAGSYSVNVSWKTINFLFEFLGTTDHSKAMAVDVPQIESEIPINNEIYLSYQGYGQRYGYPQPASKVSIRTSSVYAGQTEVTQGEYAKVTGKFPFSNFSKNTGNYPAEKITFYDALLYCNLLSALCRQGFF